jgi:hypothetical protein
LFVSNRSFLISATDVTGKKWNSSMPTPQSIDPGRWAAPHRLDRDLRALLPSSAATQPKKYQTNPIFRPGPKEPKQDAADETNPIPPRGASILVAGHLPKPYFSA